MPCSTVIAGECLERKGLVMTRKLFNWASACIAAAIAFVLPIAAMAANAPTATVSGTSVTISNESGAEGWDNASISDMSGYQGNNFTIPAIGSDLPSDTILKITSVSIAKSTSRTYMPDKLGLSGCVSAYRTITAGGFTSAAADKYTYSFADTDCLVKVGTASPVRFFQNSGAAHNSEIAFRLGSNAYQFIASIVWGGKVPIIEIQAEIVSGHIDESLTPIYETGNDRVYLSGAYGWIKTADDSNHSTAELYLVDGDYGFGFKATDANSLDGNNKNRFSVWEKLSGPGTLTAYNSVIRTPALKIYDSSGFTGSIATTGGSAQIFAIFCNDNEDSTFDNDKFYNAYYANNKGCIYISAGRTTANGRVVTIAEGATWTAPGNIFNKGELVVNGTVVAKIVNDGALTINGTVTGQISGSGTVTVNAGASIPGGFGSQRDFTGWTVDSTVTASITMTAEEYGKGLLNITGATGISSITVLAPDGTTVVTTLTPDNNGAAAYNRGTVLVSGKACWCDYEMNGNLDNTGTDITGLSYDNISQAVSFYNSQMLYTYTHPYRGVAYPSTWTAVVRCTVPKVANGAVITFGTCTGGLIGLIAGDDPDTEMKLIKTTGNSAYTTLATMSIVDGTTAQHVYVFAVENNATVKVYCDGSEVLNQTYSAFTLGGGIQVGSVHGGINDTGITRVWKGDTYAGLTESDLQDARIDCVRLYDYSLSAAQIAALSVEFPAVKLFQATISGGDANVWGSLDWTGGDISTINAHSKAIITVEDDATLTLPASITADELVFNIASGKTLTLVEAEGGSTLTIGHPVEVNTGTVAFNAANTTLGFAIGGNGSVFVDAGKTISVASGGSLTKLSGSGTVTYASYGSLPGALAFGDWTGTVVLPTFVAEGVNFNNYGQTGSTIALTGITSGWIDPDHSSASAKLRLDGAVNITAMSTRTYTFAEIDGPGNLSFATSGDQPTAINITKVAEGYTGTISNTTERDVTITTLDRQAGTTVTAGSKVLSTSSGVQASALTLAGVATSITPVFDTDGLYVKAASVTKNDATANYDTVSAALTAAGNDAATIKLLMPTDSAIALAAGQTLVNGNLTSGGVTGPNGYELVNNGGTYTLVDNTASTWADAEDHKWNTATNWSTGYCPSQYTAVTFPASANGHVVNLTINNGQPRHHCTSMTLNGNVTFQRGTNEWAYVYLYGNVTGSGTLTFVQTGLKTQENGSVTIDCPVVCNAASNDNFFSGSDSGNETFTFTNAVDVFAGELKADYSHLIFNGPVTIRNGSSVKSNHESADTTFNGGIIVPEGAAASLTVVNGGGQHTIASTVTLASGAKFTIPNGTVTNNATFVTSAEGCYVNVTTSDGNIVYSVEQIPPSVEIGVATFDYGVDYTNATVTVAVTEAYASGVEYTLTVDNKDYTASAVNGTVTFNNVEVARGTDIYAPVAYTIAAKSGETTISTTAGSSIAADGSVWFSHDSSGLIGGNWTTAVDLAEPAEVSDNTFTPTATPSSNDVVVLEFDVCFKSVSDDDIDNEAQAAIKIGEVDSSPTFMVLTNGNSWAAVSAQGITPDPTADYKVVLTMNYTTHTYGATVNGVDLKDAQNSAIFSMAKSDATGTNSLEFRGTGTLASMKGEQLDGNMVVDKNGTKYATIDAAIAAYNQDNTIGPLTMLHAGTAPTGWTIANGELTCTAAAKTVSGGVTIYYATLQGAIDAEMVATGLNQEPLAIILLANNDEVVMLDNGYKVAIDATASVFTYNAPTPLDGGDYAIDAVGSDLVGNYTVTYTARDWYEWTLTLVNANGATVTGIENGTNVTEKSPTVTFTVEPADGYSLDSVTAQVADEDAETLVASDGTYSYTLTNAVTITVNTVYDFVTLTVPLVANTDVIVTTNDVAVDGVEVGGVMQYTIRKGTPVTVAYSVGERNYYISTTHSTSVTYQISAGAMANDFTLNVGEMTAVAIVAAITRDETVGEAVQSVTRYYESLRAAVAASIVNDTITLLADDNVSFSASNLEITIDKALTIDGAGYTVYGVNDYAYDGVHDHDIYISGSGDVTIKNVTLANFAGGVSNNMRTYPIWTGSAYAGTLTLDNVTVQNFNRTAFNLNGGTVVVTNCTITGDTTKEAYFQEGIGVYNANVTIVDTAISNVGSNLEKEDSQIAACIQLGNPNGPAVGTGSITVVNGTYSGEYGIIVASNAQNAVSVQGGTFNGDLMVEEGEGGTIVVSGGLFDRQVPAEYAGANLAPTTIADGGKYTVKTARTVTFEVDNNVVYTNLVVADGEPVAAPDPAPTKDNSTFRAWQTNGVDWVFTDAVTSDIILVADWTPNNVDVTVPEKTGFTIRVTVNGDEYNTYTTENGIRTYSVPCGSNVVVTYTIDGAYIVADGATTTFAYDSIAENKAIDDSAPTAVAAVAQIGNGYYATLRSAVSAAQAGDTIVLLTNDDESFSASNLEIKIDKALTIDGAEHTIYGVNNYAGGNGDHDIYILGDGDVTIKNVTLANFGGAVPVTGRTYPIWTGSAYSGTLTLDNVTVQNFNRTAFNLNGGTVVVTNCTITGDTTKEAYFQEGIGVYNANVTIVDTAISNVGSNLEKEDSQIAACIQLGNPNGPAVGTGSITVVNGTYSGEYGIIVASNAQNAVSVQGGTFNGDLMVEEGEGGSLSISGGTFSVAIDPDYCAEGLEPYGYGDGRYTVRINLGWIYEAYDHPGYTGSWSNKVSYSEGKIAITDGNTYTADRHSDGRIVTLEMTMSFDDANDEDEDLGEVKTAVKLGTQGFRVYTSEGPSGAVTSVWKTVEIEGLELLPTANQDYTFLFVLDLTNKTYTASLITNGGVATNALALAGSTNIQFACRSNTAPVQRVEFVGSGTVTSIFGDYEDREIVLEFVDGQTIENVTLNAAQAAWLNGQDSYDALAEKIATMTQASFSDAYLLNLNILSDQYDGTYSFKVTGITVTDDKVTVTVELVRTAALTGGINGTLKLNGGATLPASGFTTLQSVDIGDEDFSEGNSTTCIFTKGEGGEKFFQPVIVAPANE